MADCIASFTYYSSSATVSPWQLQSAFFAYVSFHLSFLKWNIPSPKENNLKLCPSVHFSLLLDAYCISWNLQLLNYWIILRIITSKFSRKRKSRIGSNKKGRELEDEADINFCLSVIPRLQCGSISTYSESQWSAASEAILCMLMLEPTVTQLHCWTLLCMCWTRHVSSGSEEGCGVRRNGSRKK